ncbi:MAG TPA: TIM44-like domain-containing protein [Bacteroidales bacterium]|nr:TIM44-like domain-containing protein [Bacteroidales bacterium]HOL97480.1 TIM44-like domain-containing protein [Bacteroidales bacterium]HOM35748.1 TIM44-like domain-containing protein [Bacteroidales bacterium]HPD23034.1 TIM44-like domain-containing protein [Bacteroidales bacterium]HRS98873.1 TIM44-like domain-containing protein [Bacteroidales bacterium]
MKSRFCFNPKQFQKIILFIIFFSMCLNVFARMGGGGGDGDIGVGDGDGLIELILYLLFMLPEPYNYLSVTTIIIGAIIFGKLKKQGSILNKIDSSKIPSKQDEKGIRVFKERHPDFETNLFLEKVTKAFYDIQSAWTEKNISKVRRYITDGMYQRVNTQFKMMEILGQRNIIEKLSLKNLIIDKIESDGVFDIIHVGVYASVKDSFISEKYPNLNSVYWEEFVEYWTFIRKNSSKSNKDIYSTYNCPNCGGDLSSNMGDLSKCPYCGTITNSGEYDWVLSEITQADDYRTFGKRFSYFSNTLVNKLKEIAEADSDFAPQIIEDKASNGYLQIETARVLKNINYVKRFVNDDFLKKLEKNLKKEAYFVYNRIYLNHATLIGALQKDNKNILIISLKLSFQRVKIENSQAKIIDPVMISKNEIMLLERDVDANPANGSIYAYQCPSCGGTLTDTTNINCPYCGAILNSSKYEWIISDIMSETEYLKYFNTNAPYFIGNVNPKKLDKILTVRDYAFNNVLVMIAADGILEKEEINFVNKLASKWGYSKSKIQGMIEMAMSNKLSIKMPGDSISREKIFKMMEKAASIDGKISTEEADLLEKIKAEYRIKIK